MNFIEEKIAITLKEISKRIVTKTLPVGPTKCCVAPYKSENIPPTDVQWETYEVKSFPIAGDGHMWFCFDIDVPMVNDDEDVFLKITTNYDEWGATNPQAILYMDGSTAVQAFDQNHMECPVSAGHHKVSIYLYGHPTDTVVIRFEAFLLVKNKTVESLYYDMNVPYEAMKLLDKNTRAYAVTLNALDQACLYLDFRSHRADTFMSGVTAAIDYLEKEYYQKHCGKEDNGELSCIGHTHLDVAWYWTLAQTKEKAQRSFSTAIKLLEQYPEYLFMSSQPQLYEFVKESDPELYEKIKQQVRAGRWEAEGAMWLEPDANLTSGESFIRQLLYGKRFMREEFGVENHILWLPDVFGYSAALPQILRKSGVDTFFTTKLFWSERNVFPHTNFMWRGIDGSEVFTVQTDDQNKNLCPAIVKSAMQWHIDKRYSHTHIATFGFGDGGGGSTPKMMENYRRLQRGLPGLPKVTIRKAGDTLAITKKQFDETTKNTHFSPRWEGELYFELHRGTFTTMAENKRNNRKSEVLYQAAEETSVVTELLLDQEYPTERLEENWYPILKNQFHDILPGSSIKEVYEDCRREYDKILSEGTDILEKNLQIIADNVKSQGGYLVYNPTSFQRSEMVEYDGKSFFVRDIPPHGYAVVNVESVEQIATATKYQLENAYICVKFDENYNISSVFDKENNREVIRQDNKANVLTIYEDYPWEYDAWDIKEYYTQKKWTIDHITSVELLNEKIYAGICVTRNYGNSRIRQTIRLDAVSRRIDFVTDVDWYEDHVLLKAVFPLEVHTNRANCDIQFGFIDRPTHYNTSWDQTRFEICAHKWVDMSEGNYGVALLNDCKYGYSVQNDVLAITLLRAPTSPNPDADRGNHHFVYSLYPHNGVLVTSDVIKQGYVLNNELKVRKINTNKEGILPETFSFAKTNRDSAVIETIKKAESGEGYILRVYDSKNVRGGVELTLGVPVKKAYSCNLLEEIEEELEVVDGKVAFYLSNFEIKTILIEL